MIIDSDGRRMGRYKDYREPKRRGFDDDYAPQDRAAERPPSNPGPTAPQASEPREAIVKWFNAYCAASLRPQMDKYRQAAACPKSCLKIGDLPKSPLAPIGSPEAVGGHENSMKN
jgi:hypothetical protein